MTTSGLMRVSPPSAVSFDRSFFDHVTMGDRDLQIEVLSLFRQQIDETLQRIPVLANAEDWRHTLHRLKGAALAVGANAIASCAQHWETRVPAGVNSLQVKSDVEGCARDFLAEIGDFS